MSIEELEQLPVQDIADNNCMLFMWVTNPLLYEVLRSNILKNWGFKFINLAFIWVKQNPHSDKLKCGLGYYTRSNAEVCILAKKGMIRPVDRSVYQVHLAPVGRHSEKPQLFKHQIERLFGKLPRIELFARPNADSADTFDTYTDRQRSKVDETLFGDDETPPEDDDDQKTMKRSKDDEWDYWGNEL